MVVMVVAFITPASLICIVQQLAVTVLEPAELVVAALELAVGGMEVMVAALYSGGNITMTLCTVSGNSSGNGNSAGSGYDGYDGSVANGGVGGSGGGIFSDGKMTLIACTISYNFGGNGGTGGINSDYDGSPGGAGGTGGGGGGIFNETNSQLAQLSDCLIALNQAGVGGFGVINANGSNGAGLDISGNFVSQMYNLIGQSDGSSGVTNGINNDFAGNTIAPINPLLGPLQDNGGLTLTRALLFGSPAIDQGGRFNLTTDQRGHSQPHDYYSIVNASGGDGSDIGAFESDIPILNIQKLSNEILISWDTNCPGYTLEFTADVIPSNNWVPVSDTSLVVGTRYQVTNNITASHNFFRLQSN